MTKLKMLFSEDMNIKISLGLLIIACTGLVGVSYAAAAALFEIGNLKDTVHSIQIERPENRKAILERIDHNAEVEQSHYVETNGNLKKIMGRLGIN